MAVGKITLQEELEMWRFLLRNTENLGATSLWKQYKLVSGTTRPVQTLYNRFKYSMSPKLHTMEFSVEEKARLYKQYKIEVDPSYRDTLAEHGCRLDEQGFVVDEPEPEEEPAVEPVTAAPRTAKKRRGDSIWTTSRKRPRSRRAAGSEAAPQEPAAPRARKAPPSRAPSAPRAPRPVRGAAQPAPTPVEAPSTRRSSRARGAASSAIKPEPVEPVEPVEPIIVDVKPRVSRSRARVSGAPSPSPAPAPVAAPVAAPIRNELDSDTPVAQPAAPAASEPAARANPMNSRRATLERRRTEHQNQMSVRKILKTLEPLAERAHKTRIEAALKQLKNKDQKVSTENVRSVIDSALNILNV